MGNAIIRTAVELPPEASRIPVVRWSRSDYRQYACRARGCRVSASTWMVRRRVRTIPKSRSSWPWCPRVSTDQACQARDTTGHTATMERQAAGIRRLYRPTPAVLPSALHRHHRSGQQLSPILTEVWTSMSMAIGGRSMKDSCCPRRLRYPALRRFVRKQWPMARQTKGRIRQASASVSSLEATVAMRAATTLSNKGLFNKTASLFRGPRPSMRWHGLRR